MSALAAAGCGPQPEVFDKPAIDGLGKMMVVPLASAQEPAAGQIVAGLAEANFKTQRLPRMEVLEAPALWRLTATSTQPATISRDDMLKAAQAVGADCILTGQVTYAQAKPGAATGMPPAAAGGMEYQKKFIVRRADVTVVVRVLEASSGRAVYVFGGQADGLDNSELLVNAFNKAVRPFEDYLRDSRKK